MTPEELIERVRTLEEEIATEQQERSDFETSQAALLRRVRMLEKALIEARPYVFNRTQERDWRGEMARSILARVDAVLSGKDNE